MNVIKLIKKSWLARIIRPFYIFVSDGLIKFLSPTPYNSRLKAWLLRLRGAKIGSNPVIDQAVRIRSPENFQLGDDVLISHGVLITTGGGVTIGHRVLIGYDAKLLSTNHIIPEDINVPIRFSRNNKLPITIADDVWIAANVIITAGVTIGRGAVIAAGAVVTKNVPEGAIMAGVPARLVRTRIVSHE